MTTTNLDALSAPALISVRMAIPASPTCQERSRAIAARRPSSARTEPNSTSKKAARCPDLAPWEPSSLVRTDSAASPRRTNSPPDSAAREKSPQFLVRRKKVLSAKRWIHSDGCPPNEFVYMKDNQIAPCDPFNPPNAPCPTGYSCQWSLSNQRYQVKSFGQFFF